MELHLETLNMGAMPKAAKAEWPPRGTAAAVLGGRQVTSLLTMSTVGRQLRTWLDSPRPRPSKTIRQPRLAALRGASYSELMIRPSMYHRVIIASRRDDWP